MCLVVIARPTAPSPWELVIASNRDERHDRPADALHWWPDAPAIAGGRDRRAGGSWFAVARDGRFAAVLNAAGPARPDAPSRGSLVTRFLGTPGATPAELQAQASRYTGFHALLGDPAEVTYVARDARAPRAMTATLIACGNAGITEPGPRVGRAADGVARSVDAGDPVPALFAVLADSTDPGAGTGDTRPVFIRGEVFGTRCSSVLVAERASGRVAVHERRFDAAGVCRGERTLAWRRGRRA